LRIIIPNEEAIGTPGFLEVQVLILMTLIKKQELKRIDFKK
jgi:hypothetical protein